MEKSKAVLHRALKIRGHRKGNYKIMHNLGLVYINAARNLKRQLNILIQLRKQNPGSGPIFFAVVTGSNLSQKMKDQTKTQSWKDLLHLISLENSSSLCTIIHMLLQCSPDPFPLKRYPMTSPPVSA